MSPWGRFGAESVTLQGKCVTLRVRCVTLWCNLVCKYVTLCSVMLLPEEGAPGQPLVPDLGELRPEPRAQAIGRLARHPHFPRRRRNPSRPSQRRDEGMNPGSGPTIVGVAPAGRSGCVRLGHAGEGMTGRGM